MWWLLLLPLTALAADKDIDLNILDKLDENLPNYNTLPPETDTQTQGSGPRKYIWPVGQVTLDQIRTSGTAVGALKEGTIVMSLEDDEKRFIPKNMKVTYFLREDENGFKYLSSKGKLRYRVWGDDVIETKEVTTLFEPPDQYTPAPKNTLFAEYDSKFHLMPEPIFYTGFVDGSYMKDLFNDKRARYGKTTQFGLRTFAKWNWPILAGIVLSYERSTYNLTGNGRVVYDSPSIGPAFRTRDYEILDFAFRFQMQYRVSPFARTHILKNNVETDIRFNSSDFLVSWEHPVKNGWGEFVLGLFFQAQWLDIRAQEEATRLIANNQTNNSYGISLSQVFD